MTARTTSRPPREARQDESAHAERAQPHQRLTAAPGAYLSRSELEDARALVRRILRATRGALTGAGRVGKREELAQYGHAALSDGADVTDLTAAWRVIVRLADSVRAGSPAEIAQLTRYRRLLTDRRTRAGHRLETQAVTAYTVHAPAPGTEYPFSVSDVARAAAARLGPSWHVESEAWGVGGTLENDDDKSVLVGVDGDGDLCATLLTNRFPEPTTYFPAASPADGLERLGRQVAEAVAALAARDQSRTAGHDTE